MEARYFKAFNANRLIGGISFTPVGVFAGSLIGVKTPADEKELTVLSGLVANPASGVEEIGEAEYTARLKKKPLTGLTPFRPLAQPSGKLQQPAVVAPAVKEVPTTEKPAPAAEEPAIDINDVLRPKQIRKAKANEKGLSTSQGTGE